MTKIRVRHAAYVLLALAMPAEAQEIAHGIREGFPDRQLARLELKQRLVASVPRGPDTAPFLVLEREKKWRRGQVVKVAFRGGTQDLHRDIANVAEEWARHANLRFDFGLNPATGAYRTWSTSDTAYQAHIRVAFDDQGYWSFVGRDSVDPVIAKPHESSLNLQGFDQARPLGWEGVVIHEFGHAISAQHEHQHPAEGCDTEFRWQDDPGYIPTTDSFGQYVIDSAGRRPGIYTVLGGPPNNWSQGKVDHNLRQLTNSSAFEFSAFDPLSIMKYFFDAWMFRNGEQSQCYNGEENETLSDQDKRQVATAYPAPAPGAPAAPVDQASLQQDVQRISQLTKVPEVLRRSLQTRLEQAR